MHSTLTALQENVPRDESDPLYEVECFRQHKPTPSKASLAKQKRVEDVKKIK